MKRAPGTFYVHAAIPASGMTRTGGQTLPLAPLYLLTISEITRQPLLFRPSAALAHARPRDPFSRSCDGRDEISETIALISIIGAGMTVLLGVNRDACKLK